VLTLGVAGDRGAEPVPDGLEDHRGRDRVAKVGGEKRHHLPADLQQVRDVGVEIDAFQALDVQDNVTVQRVVDIAHRRHDPPPPREDSLGLPSTRTIPAVTTHVEVATRRSEAGLTG